MNGVVRERSRRWHVVQPLIAHGHKIFTHHAGHRDPLEQLMCRGVPERTFMAEQNELPRRHLTPRRRAVELEHLLQRLPQNLQIAVAEPGLLGELGIDETVCAVETVRNDVLAAMVRSLSRSRSFVTDDRVIDISSGMIISAEREKQIWTGPRTCPAFTSVVITAPNARMSKKCSHIQAVIVCPSCPFGNFLGTILMPVAS